MKAKCLAESNFWMVNRYTWHGIIGRDMPEERAFSGLF